jgi:hypothetical protein
MPDIITPSLAQDFASRDYQRLTGQLTLSIMRRTPWADVLGGGTFENGLSDEQRSVVVERAVVGQSLTVPQFVNDTDACGLTGPAMQPGSTEYVTRLGTLRGQGPRICVKGMRSAFQNSYSAAQDSMQKQLLMLGNADIRAQLFLGSGIKAKVQTGIPFESMISGDIQRLNVSVNNSTPPDSTLTFSFLEYLNQFAIEDLTAEPFEAQDMEGAGVGTVGKFIGSQAIINTMRREAGVVADLRSLVTGRYDIGQESITGYTWQGPLRGIALGIDSQPLRFNAFVTVGGQLIPQFIEPEIAVQVSKGWASRPNAAWRTAQYEVGFMVYSNSFRRLVPEQYTGVGDWRFPAQYSQGELEFTVIRDSLNPYGDWGQHLFQIIRAYRPERPHAIIPILYKRCLPDLGLAACTVGSYSGYTGTYSF